jgi:hypothetical protein
VTTKRIKIGRGLVIAGRTVRRALGAIQKGLHGSRVDGRIREIVYVLGAGFSGGLGYPLTNNLLVDVWDRLEDEPKDRLRRIIEFHHPAFDQNRKTTFPDIEQLLSEIAVKMS